MNKILKSIIIICILVFSSCSDDAQKEEDAHKEAPIIAVKLTPEEHDLIKDLKTFSIDFFRSSCEVCNGNIMLSPLSMYIPLSILANGARRETKNEILNVLGIESDKLDAINKLNAKLMAELPMVDVNADFSLANSLWLNDSYEVLESYVDDIKTKYEANIFTDIFTYKTSERINKWGNEKTKGLISTSISRALDDLYAIACPNALYFKCQWSIPFDKEKTKPGIFFNIDESLSIVEMMNGNKIPGKYTEIGYMRAVTLYLGNMGYQFTLLLPKDGYNLPEAISNFTEDDLTYIGQNSYAYDININLPQFSIESKVDGIPILGNMGIENGLESGDFSGIFKKENIGLTHIEQSVSFSIDEGKPSTIENRYHDYNPMFIDITFDHPFAFFIREITTSTIVFAGKVEKF